MTGVQISGRIDADAFALDYAACVAAPERHRVPDIGALVPGREGVGVRMAHVLDLADPLLEARWVTIESEDGAFAASLPIEEIAADGVLVYERGGEPLCAEDGGPFRLYIPGYRDACANVKALARLTFTDSPGRDTRPSRQPKPSQGGEDCRPSE